MRKIEAFTLLQRTTNKTPCDEHELKIRALEDQNSYKTP